jgi:siroheme synthase
MPSSRRGRLALVGVGTGDADMLSIAGRAELELADVVLADDYVPPKLLDLARGRVAVAEKRDESTLPLAEQMLNVMALDALGRGERVVRLKSGDPYLYARGGEELLFFRSHGYEPRLVTGACAPLVAPDVAGLAVTKRGSAEQLHVVSAYTRNATLPELPAFVAARTLVVMLPVDKLGALVDQLRTSRLAYPSDLPVVLVEKASTPEQRVLRGTLDTIVAIATAAAIGAPLLFMTSVVFAEKKAATAVSPAVVDGAGASVSASPVVARSDKTQQITLPEKSAAADAQRTTEQAASSAGVVSTIDTSIVAPPQSPAGSVVSTLMPPLFAADHLAFLNEQLEQVR